MKWFISKGIKIYSNFYIYYKWNSFYKIYEIRIENKEYSNSLLIAETKTEKKAQEITKTLRRWEKRETNIDFEIDSSINCAQIIHI